MLYCGTHAHGLEARVWPVPCRIPPAVLRRRRRQAPRSADSPVPSRGCANRKACRRFRAHVAAAAAPPRAHRLPAARECVARPVRAPRLVQVVATAAADQLRVRNAATRPRMTHMYNEGERAAFSLGARSAAALAAASSTRDAPPARACLCRVGACACVSALEARRWVFESAPGSRFILRVPPLRGTRVTRRGLSAWFGA
eukprot:357143-Chlamydomonas_euryale.AAC.1